MKYNNDKSYKISFYLAITLHVILALLLGIKLAKVEKNANSNAETPIIQAFSVNNSSQASTKQDIEKTTKTLEQKTEEKIEKKVEPKPEPKPEVKPQPEPKRLEQPKIQKKENLDLDKALREKMLQDQQAEIQAIDKEVEKKKKQQLQEKQKKEKQLLHESLSNELAKEDSKISKQIKVTQATNQTQQQEATTENTNNNINNKSSENNADSNAQNSEVIDKYKSLIIQAISQQWIVPDDLDKNLVCKLLINVGPGGVVLRIQVTQASGNPLLDRSAQNAVMKASPLPVPKETSLLDSFRVIQLTVKPNEIT